MYGNIIISSLVNNFEISSWQYIYLSIWKSVLDTEKHSYIKASTFFAKLGIPYYDLLKYYFLIYGIYNNIAFINYYILYYFKIDERVTVNTFFPFVCLVCFTQLDSFIHILLSVCGIHSNVAYKYDQIATFVKAINPTAFSDGKVAKWFNDQYILYILYFFILYCLFYIIRLHKDLIPFSHLFEMIKTTILYTTIEEVRNKVIFKFIGKDEYEIIVARKVFFDEILSHPNLQLPKETCLHQFVRVVIDSAPPPFHTEYRNVDETHNINQTFDNVLLQIRTRYGYSRRHTSCVRSRSKLLSSSMKKSFCNQSNDLRRNSNASCGNINNLIQNNNNNALATNPSNNTGDDFDKGINRINKDIQKQRRMSSQSQLDFKVPLARQSIRSMRRISVQHPLSARSCVVIKQ